MLQFNIKQFIGMIGASCMAFMNSLFAPKDDEQVDNTISVLLDHITGEGYDTLHVNGPYILYDNVSPWWQNIHLSGKMAPFGIERDSIVWGKKKITGSVTIVPLYGTTIMINGIQYGGAISLIAEDGAVLCINKLDIENYVNCLVGRVRHDLHEQTMRVLAVSIRTDAWYRKKHPSSDMWDCKASAIGYKGVIDEFRRSDVRRVCGSTKGLIMYDMDHEGNLHDVFPITIADDINIDVNDKSNNIASLEGCDDPVGAIVWEYSISISEFASRINHSGKGIEDVFCDLDLATGKVVGLKAYISDGSSIYIDINTIRDLFKDAICSNDFVCLVDNNRISFSGFGRGFNKGICLLKLEQYADSGLNEEIILHKCFPNVVVLESDFYNTNL